MQFLSTFVDHETIAGLPVVTAKVLLGYAAFALAFALAERFFHGLSMRRYLTPAVRNDYLYCVFFNSGYFAILAYPFIKATELLTAPVRIDVMAGLPVLLATIAFLLVTDFTFYWTHRLLHTRWFWRFHRIHHSQRELTYLTTSRFHVVDALMLSVITYVPIALLGWPAEKIVLIAWILAMQDRMQHASLDFTYGALYPVIVSPRYHRIHHAADAERGHSNFARIFPIWDRLFGTAHRNAERPEKVGIEGDALPENILAHFVAPFRRFSSPSPAASAGGPEADASGNIPPGAHAGRLPLA